MRILLTGHKGYIGTVMAPMLIAEGHQLTGLDSDLYRGCTFGELPPLDIEEINKDIRDVQVEDIAGHDAVIHLAGLSNDPLGNLDPALTEEINYKATVRLAKLARQAGVGRFIFSSTCSVYGAAGEDWIDETAKPAPITPYGQSKAQAEVALADLANDDFSPIFLRSATAFGVSPRLRFDLVLNNLVAWAVTSGEIYLKSDGRSWRPLVHIEDIGRAFIAALGASRQLVHNQAFNVGRSSDNYRVTELAEIVAATVPGSQVQYAEGAGPDKRSYRVDCSKLGETLPDFQPQWDARKGAQQLYQAIKGTQLQPEDFEGPQYSRIAHIKDLLQRQELDATLRWQS